MKNGDKLRINLKKYPNMFDNVFLIEETEDEIYFCYTTSVMKCRKEDLNIKDLRTDVLEYMNPKETKNDLSRCTQSECD